MNRHSLLLCALCLLATAGRCHPQPSPTVDAGMAGTGGSAADGGVSDASLDAPADAWNPPLPDVGPDPAAECLAAEKNLKAHGCTDSAGAPLWVGPDGAGFATQCLIGLSKGIDYHASCIARVTSCAQVNSAATGAMCAQDGS